MSSLVFVSGVNAEFNPSGSLANEQQPRLVPKNPTNNNLNTGLHVPAPSLNVFSINKGQINNSNIRYYYESSSLFVGFLKSKVLYTFVNKVSNQFITFNITFDGSNSVLPTASEKVGSPTNYFTNNNFKIGIESFASVTYHNIYNNIDLHFYFVNNSLKYEFISHSGEINQIRIQATENVNFTVNSNQVNINFNGKNFTYDSHLNVYEIGSSKTIQSSFVQYPNNSYGFKIDSTKKSQNNIIIDPLLFSQLIFYNKPNTLYYGDQAGSVIRADSNGNVWVAGTTDRWTFITKNALDPTFNNKTDIFLMKFDSNWNLLFSTFIGGSADDIPTSMVLDSAGNCFLSGTTDSSNFPKNTTFTVNNSLGAKDIFILKISSDGQHLLFSDVLGGRGIDTNSQIVLDKNNNNIIVAGFTNSANFPYTNDSTSLLFLRQFHEISNYFIAQISPDGTKLLRCSLLQKADVSAPVSIALDSNNNLIVVGTSSIENITTTSGVFQSSGKGFADVFIVKINAGNFSLIFDTYLGGSNVDEATAVAVDSNNNIHVTGFTVSPDFPLSANAFDKSLHSGKDIFVSILSSNGSKLLASTIVGGNDHDYPTAIAVNSKGATFITGWTQSTDFPLTANAIIILHKGGIMVFITKLSPDLSAIYYSSYFGGNQDDKANSLYLDAKTNDYYITGVTLSNDFPSFYRLNQTFYASKAFISEFFDVPKDNLKFAIHSHKFQPDPIMSFLIKYFFSGLIIFVVLTYAVTIIKKRNNISK